MTQPGSLSYPPRGLARDEAARYIGASPEAFDSMVADGRMPKPKQIGGKQVWDRLSLDAAFTALPTLEDGKGPAPVTDKPVDAFRPKNFTPKALSERWSCSERHVRNMCKSGVLPWFKVGGQLLRIRALDVEAFERGNAQAET